MTQINNKKKEISAIFEHTDILNIRMQGWWWFKHETNTSTVCFEKVLAPRSWNAFTVPVTWNVLEKRSLISKMLTLLPLVSSHPRMLCNYSCKTSDTLSKVITFTLNVGIMQSLLLFHLSSSSSSSRPLFLIACILNNPLFNDRRQLLRWFLS